MCTAVWRGSLRGRSSMGNKVEDITMENKQGPKPRLGFIGMGGMGSRMAGRLLDAGYDLTVYNRERAKARPLEQRGAKVATTPSHLAEGVDVVLSSIAADSAVVNVLCGH